MVESGTRSVLLYSCSERLSNRQPHSILLTTTNCLVLLLIVSFVIILLLTTANERNGNDGIPHRVRATVDNHIPSKGANIDKLGY